MDLPDSHSVRVNRSWIQFLCTSSDVCCRCDLVSGELFGTYGGEVTEGPSYASYTRGCSPSIRRYWRCVDSTNTEHGVISLILLATPSRALESALSSLLPPLLNLGQHPRSLVQLIIQSLSPTKLPSSAHRTSTIPRPSQRTWPATPTDEDREEVEDAYADTDPNDVSAPATSITFASRASGINATALAIMVASSLQLKAVPVAISLALLPLASPNQPYLVVDPTMEEEAKAIARFGFAWAIGHGLGGATLPSTGMDVDDDLEGLDMELVWVDSEGSISRTEVCPSIIPFCRADLNQA